MQLPIVFKNFIAAVCLFSLSSGHAANVNLTNEELRENQDHETEQSSGRYEDSRSDSQKTEHSIDTREAYPQISTWDVVWAGFGYGVRKIVSFITYPFRAFYNWLTMGEEDEKLADKENKEFIEEATFDIGEQESPSPGGGEKKEKLQQSNCSGGSCDHGGSWQNQEDSDAARVPREMQDNIAMNSKESPFLNGKRSIKKMAIIGDGVASGYLVDTTKGKRPHMSSPAAKATKKYYFSHSRFFEAIAVAQRVYRENFSSAYSGQMSKSHAARLGLREDKVQNLASSRESLASQVSRIDFEVDYIIYQMGASQICNEEAGNYEFKQISWLLETVGKRFKDPLVLIVPPLDLGEIYKRHNRDDKAFTFLLSKHSCADIRDGAKYGAHTAACPLLASEGYDQEIFDQRYREMLDSVHDKLVSVARKQKLTKVVFAQGVQRIRLADQEIAIDCLHPNAAGHDKLSEVTFRSVEEHLIIP